MWLKESKDNLRTIICKILVAKGNKPDWNESKILTFSPQRQTDQFHVADGSTTAMWWAGACPLLHKSWRHVRLKLPSPRKRLHLKFPNTLLGKPLLPQPSLRSCPLPIIPLSLSREEGVIHFFVGSRLKKPESGLFSDWIGNNTDDLRCCNCPKCRYPWVLLISVCIFACVMSSEYTREFVIKFLLAQFSWIWRMPK